MASIVSQAPVNQAAGAERLDVCLATKYFYPVYVGPPLRFMRYAPGLQQRGIHLNVFTQHVTGEVAKRDGLLGTPRTSAAGSPNLQDSIPDGLAVERVTVPSGWGRSRVYYQKLLRHCETHRPRIATVQFLNMDLWSIPYTAKLHRLGVSTVFTYTLLSDLSEKPWKRSLQRLHRRLPLDRVHQIVVSSTVMRRRLDDLGVSAPVSVIPNGVDLDRFRPADDENSKVRLRRKLGLGEYSEIILAIGPISPRKGTDSLVEAYARLARRYPRSQLVLVGPRHDLGRGDLAVFRDRIQRAIQDAGAEDQVIFTGARNNVEEYLKAADVFVFPSHREGMPNVVPEAMGCQLPLVLTPFHGLPAEFGVPGKQFLLSDWAPATLAASIEQLLISPAQRREFGLAARAWAVSNLDVERSLNEYASLYRQTGRTLSGRD